MRDIQYVLQLWGTWAATDNDNGLGFAKIATGFQELYRQRPRKNCEVCSDDDGLIISKAIGQLKKYRQQELQLLVLKYVYRCSIRTIAEKLKISKTEVAYRTQVAESFVEGCLVMTDVVLECDLFAKSA